MKALTYHGSKDVRVETVADPKINYMPQLLEHIANGELHPEAIITHTMPLADAARGYEIFEKKQEDCRQVVLTTR